MTATDVYLETITAIAASGDATEHTYRPAFKAWIEGIAPKVTATNEPKQAAANAPDFDIKITRRHGALSIGKVEAKDIGISPNLKSIEDDSARELPRTTNGSQLRRYRRAFPNLLVTDYLNFRWYQNGVLKLVASLGNAKDGKVAINSSGVDEVEGLIKAFVVQAPERLNSAPALARRMAGLAAVIHDVIRQSFATKSSSAETLGLLQAFRDTLVPDLSEESFADMLAQTIAYGMFAARVQHSGGAAFTRSQAAP
jgi:hypothetical protein